MLTPIAPVPIVIPVMQAHVALPHLLVPLTITTVATWLPVVPVLQEELPSRLHAIRVTQPLTMVKRPAKMMELGPEGNVKK
jgi:hypothetical protein